LRDNTRQWDYSSVLPESLRQVTMSISERGIRATLRHLHGDLRPAARLWNCVGAMPRDGAPAKVLGRAA
jgi:catalase